MESERRNRFRPRALVGSYRVDDPTSYDPEAIEAPKVNWPVFTVSAIGVVALAVWAFFGRGSAERALVGITTWISVNLGWFYILTATAAVVFVIIIALARTGRVRLGPDHSRPQFGLFSWSAMLFAAGIGVDLLFFAVAEPLTQYYGPPQGPGETREAAENAVVYALFHYGITGWALYALLGMAFGYYAYRLNMPLAIRSALYPLIGKRIHGPIGHAVDIAATLGTIFGIAASLGIGVVQLNYGLKLMFGWSEGPTAQAALVIVSVLVATASAVSGVDRGIKALSELNVILAMVFMFFIVFTGRTGFLFDALMMNVGDYADKFVGWTMNTYAFSEQPEHTQEWLQTWTLFFWAWWVAWAPFVGLFLARISRGRTLRQFVFGTLTIPFLFILLWMSFFGNSALDRVRHGDEAFGRMAIDQPQRGFYDLLQSYPGAPILVALATFIGLLLYITSADSGALIMSNFTSKIKDARQDGPRWSRIFWSATVGILTLVMLQINGVTTVQSATIVMGLPFTVVIYLIMFSLWKSLRLEAYQKEARSVALHGAISGRTDSANGDPEAWRERLARAVTWPNAEHVQAYLKDVAAPALEKVAHELRDQGFDANLLVSEVPDCPVSQLDLGVALGKEMDFRYQLYPGGEELPVFAGAARRAGDAGDRFYRLEVYDQNGSKGYDVYGYTQEQLIGSVLDMFERHLEFLHMQRDLIGTSDLTDGAEPKRNWVDDER